MEKALRILSEDLLNAKSKMQEQYINEAIEELEAVTNRSCCGCKFGKYGIDSFGVEVECKLNWDCTRGKIIDRYESEGTDE